MHFWHLHFWQNDRDLLNVTAVTRGCGTDTEIRVSMKTAEILLAESCREQVSFESGFKQRKGRRISEIGWQRVPEFQTEGARKLEDLFKC